MWLIIARKEFLLAARNKLFYVLAAIIWLLLIVAVTGGYRNYLTAHAQREKATTLFRHEWEEQERNPHSAAHFGTFLFKPITFLNIYDNGLNNYTGLTYRVEAHHRHEVNYSKAEDTDSQLRFGELTIALVFQLLIPLLIIFTAFSSVTAEREDNTLRMMLAQGVKPFVLTWGKVLGNYALIVAILAPVLLLLTVSYAVCNQEQSVGLRILVFLVMYLLYFFIITAITVLISVVSKSSRASLLTNLGVWVLLGILLPRMAAQAADRTAPLPSRFAFDRNVQKGITNGINNDGNSTERFEKFRAATLRKYGVDSVQQLPFNFAGASMQFGEEYQQKVYDKYADEIEVIIHHQQRTLGMVSFFDPYMAIQQVSMGLTAADYDHHLAFHHQAQRYRDEFIRVLNLKLADSKVAADNTFDFKVDSHFFKQMTDFHYQLPPFMTVIRWHWLSLAAIAVWLVLIVALLPIFSKRLHYC